MCTDNKSSIAAVEKDSARSLTSIFAQKNPVEMTFHTEYILNVIVGHVFLIFGGGCFSTVGCEAGKYFDNDTMTCNDCPVGQYQDEEAQFTCKMCPHGTSTIGYATRNDTDCLGR